MNTALLVLDMQAAVIKSLPNYTEITQRIAQAIATARRKNIPVIYAVVGFRPGMPEVHANNKIFAASKARAGNADMSSVMKIDDAVAPLPEDIIVTKRRVSAFASNDLALILQAQNIQHIILTGVSTSGVVLSTLREAADKDYLITVLADCCTDRDPELHDILTRKVFPMQASVMTLAEWKAS